MERIINKNRLIKLEREMKILKNSFDKYHLNENRLFFYTMQMKIPKNIRVHTMIEGRLLDYINL